jgi:hypothetical protein
MDGKYIILNHGENMLINEKINEALAPDKLMKRIANGESRHIIRLSL